MAEQPRPLASYAALAGAFTGGLLSFLAVRRAGDGLPARIAPSDVALLGVATHKLSRLIAKDRIAAFLRAPFAEPQALGVVPGEVEERARGDGPRAAVGQLLTCPHCLSMWIAAVLAGGLVAAPRETRLVAATLTTATVSDFLQAAYRRAARRDDSTGGRGEPATRRDEPVAAGTG